MTGGKGLWHLSIELFTLTRSSEAMRSNKSDRTWKMKTEFLEKIEYLGQPRFLDARSSRFFLDNRSIFS